MANGGLLQRPLDPSKRQLTSADDYLSRPRRRLRSHRILRLKKQDSNNISGENTTAYDIPMGIPHMHCPSFALTALNSSQLYLGRRL